MEKLYTVKVTLSRIDGGIPAHPDVVANWLLSHEIEEESLEKKFAEGTLKEEEIEEQMEKITNTFMVNEAGEPCIEARCVKAALKQAAGVMGLYAIPGLRELLKEGTEVYQMVDGKPATVPGLIPLRGDEIQVETKPMHCIGPQGPRTALKRVRYITNAKIEFAIRVLDRAACVAAFPGADKAKLRKQYNTFTLDAVRAILEYVFKFTGLGANRSTGCGKGFDLVIEEVKNA